MQIFDINAKKDKKIDYLADDTEANRLTRKLVDVKKNYTRSNKEIGISNHELSKQTDNINQQIIDNKSLRQILPDLKLASQVLISGILSPKDLMTYELTYKLNNSVLDKDISGNIIEKIKEYFDNTYKLLEISPKILDRVLFISGSYPILTLPENSVDTIINSNCLISTEEYKATIDEFTKDIGLLGNGNNNFHINSYTTITDNYNIMKKPWLRDKYLSQSVESIIDNTYTSEPCTKSCKYYVKRKYDHVPFDIVRPPSEEGLYGEPIVFKLPSESVVPVHVPSDSMTHLGYFILLDKNGYPISGKEERKEIDRLRSSKNMCANDRSSTLIKETKFAIYGEQTNVSKSIDSNREMYTYLVEESLNKRLKEGIYGDDAQVADVETIAGIMLSRALKKKHTSVLYVPIQLMTYIAFDFNDKGIGKSLLEDGMLLASLRSVLLFSNVMASVKNSVPRTGVNINLDPEDPDPQATVEFLLNEFMKSHNQSFPIGITNPADITDAIQRSSIDVTVRGNAAYPETSIDVNDKSRSVSKPDTELENQMRRRHYMSLGLPPEIIDADMNIDFATMLISSNLLTAKQITIYQKLFTACLTKFVKTYVRYSDKLKTIIEDIISENKGSNATVDDLIESIEISLPEPDNAKLENQVAAFNTYSSALDTMIDAYFSNDMLGRTLDNELEDAIEPTIKCIKSFYLRQWMRSNNVLPELDALSKPDDDDSPLNVNTMHKDHLEAIIDSVGALLAGIRKNGREWLTKLENAQRKYEEKQMQKEEEANAAKAEEEALQEEVLETPEEEAVGGEEGEEVVEEEGGGEEGEEGGETEGGEEEIPEAP